MKNKDKYKEAQESIKKLRNEARKAAKGYFNEASKEFFTKYPELKSFSWTQYTPYFNDGEECTFSVNAYSESIGINGENGYNIEDPALQKIQEDISEFIKSFDEDDLKDMFGDHSEITVTKDGASTDSYDHE
jgi:hypothetical protein